MADDNTQFNPQTQGQQNTQSHDQSDTQSYDQSNAQANRPVETLREGPLKSAIWRNENDNGTYHSVSFSRTYKDQQGNLQDTTSFRPQDMLSLSELARRTHHEAGDLDRELFKEQRRNQQEQSRGRGQRFSR